ncbi:stage V sporulation protein AC [Zongyangia hominis]|uniref:Stage V sporulation protein AC n=1 Tax=Zongyangia hominis TaxID=2763677 RepID=A0A926EES0_9FIRM|nr:stage V sporulation protein AC [Zongyangia hominis]MBC8570387.1 stage V sporulation protein AC [Zongyangia hominis]
MSLTPNEYEQLNKKYSPSSKTWKNCAMAFLVGGLICTLGQAIMNISSSLGLSVDESGAAVSISLIFIAALLTGLNVFDNIAKVGGAGALVPITGFSNSIVAPALEFKSEGYVLGLGAKMFVIAGPVLVYGITVSVVYGIILYLFHIV